jgi:hypothetical protein
MEFDVEVKLTVYSTLPKQDVDRRSRKRLSMSAQIPRVCSMPIKGWVPRDCSFWRPMDHPFAWRLHFLVSPHGILLKLVVFDTLPIVPGMHLACRQPYTSRAQSIPTARNLVSPFIWMWIFRGRSLQTGSFTVLSPLPNGGTILSSPETTCSSSGRRNRSDCGVRRTKSLCVRLWI